MTASPHFDALDFLHRTPRVLCVRTLGTAEIDANQLRATPDAPRRFAFLFRLAADAGRRLPRTVIRDMVFPDLPEQNARHSLRDLVYQIRRAGVEIDADADGILLPAHDVTIDYAELISSSQPTAGQLAAASGGFLPGYTPTLSESFTEWLESFKTRVSFETCRSLSRLMIRARTVADWELAERAANACLGLDPSHEEATLILAEALAATGSKARAEQLLDNYALEIGAERARLQVVPQVIKRRISDVVGERARSETALPFAGRDAEMFALRERFELARCGQAQCVAIVGDAGIGKSRLAEEFCTQALLDGARIEYVSTQPHDSQRPLATFADLVPKLLKLPGALGCAPESMSALQRLITSEPEPVENGPHAEVIAVGISRAITDLVAAVAHESLLVILIDDVQWMDELSQHILATLVGTRQSIRLLALLTGREKKILSVLSRQAEHLLVLILRPLCQEEVARILAAFSRTSQLPKDQEAQEWIGDSSQGNPLFLRTLVSHYQTTGERFVVPSTLSALLDQRLLTISEDALSVLGMSVALGRNSNIEHLVAGLEIPYIRLQAAVRELEGASLLASPGSRIEPAHSLIADAVNRAVSPIARKLLHRRAAAILETEAKELRSAASYWDCAEHWLLGEEPMRACEALETCADQSVHIGRPREAAELLLRAASLVGGTAQCDFLRRCIVLADAAREPAIVLQAIETARGANLDIASPDIDLIEAEARIAVCDDSHLAATTFRRWLRESHSTASRIRAAHGLLVLAMVDYNPCLAEEAIDAVTPDLNPDDESIGVASLLFLMRYHSRFGMTQTAVDVANRLFRIAENQPPLLAAEIGRSCGVTMLKAGHVERARDAFLSSYTELARRGLVRGQCLLAILLSDVASVSGDDEKHRYWIEVAERACDSVVDGVMYSDIAIERSVNACLRSDPVGAQRWLDAALLDSSEESTARLRRIVHVLKVWISQLKGKQLNVDATVESLVSHHRLDSEFSEVGDVEVFLATKLLSTSGRTGEARQILDRYVAHYRRDLGPFPRQLQDLAAQIDWIGSPTLTPTRTMQFLA